jgi:hypothetical protein
MSTKYAPNGFAETREAIGWAVVSAPDFKGRFTLDEVFADLEYGLSTTEPTLKDAERLAVLEQVRGKLHESKAAFESILRDRREPVARVELKPAIQALQEASELFRSLRRPRNPPPGPDPGESADDTVDG